MNSAEAREYVRLATTETKGRTKMACDLLIAESVKLGKIEQIVKDHDSDRMPEDFWYIDKIREVLENE